MLKKRNNARRVKVAPAPPAPPAPPPKRGRRNLLTPETQAIIVQAIESGSFDYVAAAAAGISERTFRFWVELGAEAEKAAERAEEAGEEAGEEPPRPDAALYADFYAAVRAARAAARQKAEARVFNEDPFKWLRYGPGRERPGAPGWGDGEASGPITEISQGDMTIKTYWGRASDRPPARPDEEVSDGRPDD